MGLGKTVQLISVMLGNPRDRTLIVLIHYLQWRDELNKFAPQLSVHVYDGPERTIDKHAKVTIAPYTLLSDRKSDTTPLHRVSWDRVILDEAHEIRNKQSKTFKSVRTQNGYQVVGDRYTRLQFDE